jgi:hypothetical protein
MNETITASVPWQGPDFRRWWEGDWPARVAASLEEGVGDPGADRCFERIRNAYLKAGPERAPVADFLRWVDHARGLDRYVVATGELRHPLAEECPQASRLFPEIRADWSPPGQRCRLVRFAIDSPRRVRLLALVPDGTWEPALSAEGPFDEFLERLRERRLIVDWQQGLEEIRAGADAGRASEQEAGR